MTIFSSFKFITNIQALTCLAIGFYYYNKPQQQQKQKPHQLKGSRAIEPIVELYSFLKATWFYIYSPAFKICFDLLLMAFSMTCWRIQLWNDSF